MPSPITEPDLASLEPLLGKARIVDGLRETAPSSYEAAAAFWRVPIRAGALTPRMVELVLADDRVRGCEGSVPGVARPLEPRPRAPHHVYETGLRRHIRNAIGRGATRAEILQVFQLAALLGLEGYVIGARALFGERTQ
jgi:alkylhydroperoxidase/carboxymuconolactone decarboxylase family protein YurZ